MFHGVRLFLRKTSFIIGHLAVDNESNEIQIVQAFIRLLDIKGFVVVIDALNCQRETAKEIVNGSGNYLLVVIHIES